ncbi:hypothetical protein BDY24DRAFT_383536 [Mrakia frigida]|uniref:uncharacterized protein n=1 Tax=Mrakia frigida TaxID=29902 RepID=UPI003FCC1B5A
MASSPIKRRRLLLLLSLSFPLVLFSLFTYSSPSSLDPFRTFILSSATISRSSSIENYFQGSWEPLSSGPITNLSSLNDAYPGYFFHDGTCGGGLERLYKIASWEWVGKDRKRTEWDGRRFVLDALRREGGVMLVGDSITLMHYSGLSRLLDGLSFTYRTLYKTNEKLFVQSILAEVIGNPLHAVIKLNKLHPAVKGLLEEAGVGEERLEVPVVAMLRNDFLGTTREVLDRACEENGAEFNWDARGIFLFDWLATARNYTSKPSPYKTLLILNTGMHFGVAPFKDRNAPVEVVLGVVNSLVQASYTSLSTLPNIQVIVRTSYPGEAECEKSTAPFTDVSQATTNIYGWDRVPAFNAILKDNMPLLLPSSSSFFTPSPPDPLLLDVERQGTLRGDARLKPNVDCLHICPTGIAEDWGRWVGMVLRGEEGWGS